MAQNELLPQDYLSHSLYEFSVGKKLPAVKLAKRACLYYNELLRKLEKDLSQAHVVKRTTDQLTQALAVYDGLKNSKDTSCVKILDRQTQIVYLSSNIAGNLSYPWMDPTPLVSRVDLNLVLGNRPQLSELQIKSLSNGSGSLGTVHWTNLQPNHKCDSSEIYNQSPVLEDCSVVASLISMRNLERRSDGGKSILAQCLVQAGAWDEQQLYAVKLMQNGCLRKVTIDNAIPTALKRCSTDDKGYSPTSTPSPQQDTVPLTVTCTCADFATCENTKVAALVEKAYVSLMGGYGFPGSHSAVDTFVLSGWIPEYIPIHEYFEEVSASKTYLWERLRDGWRDNNLMICLGTPAFSSKDSAALRLAPSHDYTVLDMREVCNSGEVDAECTTTRQVKIRNPWSKASCKHRSRSTHDLLYCEWVDFDLVCSRFYCIYLNWDPSLFHSSQKIHYLFSTARKEKNVLLELADRPQFVLENINPKESCMVNILNVAHSRTAFQAHSQDFFSISLFDTDELVRASTEYKCLAKSPLRNTTYSMLRYVLPPKSKMVLLVDWDRSTDDKPQQTSSLSVLPMSLTVYSTSSQQNVRVTRAKTNLPHQAKVQDAFTPYQCGGNWSLKSYKENPHFKLTLSEPATRLRVYLVAEQDGCNANADEQDAATQPKLNCPKTRIPVNISVFLPNSQSGSGELDKSEFSQHDMLCGSGAYRTGSCIASTTAVPKGTYTIVPSTYDVLQTGDGSQTSTVRIPFTIMVFSDVPLTLKKHLASHSSLFKRSVTTPWNGTNSMHALFHVARTCRVTINVSIADRSPSTPSLVDSVNEQTTQYRPYIRASIIDDQSGSILVNSGHFSDPKRQISCSAPIRGNRVYWCLIERMEAGYGVVHINFHSEVPVSIDNVVYD